jgi:hypothetical protein
MRREPEWFGEDEVELVQLSRKLREAKNVEAALDEAGIDYAVEADKYQATFLLVFPTERYGAFFYVRPPDAARAREHLRAKGFMVMETLP